MIPLENHYSHGIKKILFEILKEKYESNNYSIEKICEEIKKEKDYKEMSNLILEIYNKGFSTAISQQKEMLENLGIKVRVQDGSVKTTPDAVPPKIFK